MSSTYSTNLGLELIGTGDQAGTWGTTTNTNLGTLLEQAISGYYQYACTGGTDTITIPNGVTGVARNMYLEFTGTGGGTVLVPTNKKLYFVYNSTAAAITLKVSGLTGVSIPAGARMSLACNGTDIVPAINYMASPTFASPTLTGTPIAPTAAPGTNTTQIATTAFVTGATGNLGTMSTQNANNVNITGGSISGITALPVASGGTGSGTASGARTNLGLVIGTDVPSPTGGGASGTWGISISGSAASATTATTATSAGTVTTTVASGATGTTQSNNDNSTKIATTAYVQNMSLGLGQTWTDVTSSRVSNTTYTNNTGKPIQVHIICGGGGVNFYVNSLVFLPSTSSGAIIDALIPPGNTYVCSCSAIQYWYELR